MFQLSKSLIDWPFAALTVAGTPATSAFRAKSARRPDPTAEGSQSGIHVFVPVPRFWRSTGDSFWDWKRRGRGL